MTITIGKVIDVFIPEQYQNNSLLDIMDRTNIGFKIQVNNEIKEVILPQDESNAKIMKNDLVTITERIISGMTFTDINLYDGDIYE